MRPRSTAETQPEVGFGVTDSTSAASQSRSRRAIVVAAVWSDVGGASRVSTRTAA